MTSAARRRVVHLVLLVAITVLLVGCSSAPSVAFSSDPKGQVVVHLPPEGGRTAPLERLSVSGRAAPGEDWVQLWSIEAAGEPRRIAGVELGEDLEGYRTTGAIAPEELTGLEWISVDVEPLARGSIRPEEIPTTPGVVEVDGEVRTLDDFLAGPADPQLWQQVAVGVVLFGALASLPFLFMLHWRQVRSAKERYSRSQGLPPPA